MNRNDCRHALGEVIEREIELAHDLGRALAAEADALREIDPTALDAATAAKQSCVEQLVALDTERQRLWAVADPGQAGAVVTALTDLDASGGLTERWQSLMALLETCREANQRNGAVVSMQRKRVVEALGLLQGAPDGAATYDASGEVAEADTPHVLTII